MMLTDMIRPRGIHDSPSQAAKASPKKTESEILEASIQVLLGQAQRVGDMPRVPERARATVFRQDVQFKDGTKGQVYVTIGHIGRVPSGFVSYARECPKDLVRLNSCLTEGADGVAAPIKRAGIVSAPPPRRSLDEVLRGFITSTSASRIRGLDSAVQKIDGGLEKVGTVPYSPNSGSSVYRTHATFTDGTSADVYIKAGWVHGVPSGYLEFCREAPKTMVPDAPRQPPPDAAFLEQTLAIPRG